MIATSGDEAFVMLAMFPQKALLLIALTFGIGIIAGFLTDLVFPKLNFIKKLQNRKLPLHKEEKCDCFAWKEIKKQLRYPTMQRVLLIIIVAILIFGVLQGSIAHEEQNWIRMTLLITSLLAMFVVITVPDHFLEEHLWNHIVKIHIPKIFLWTFGALIIIEMILKNIDIPIWVSSNQVVVIIVACIVGLIPESGPHLVFVSLFATGSIPFSVLLASSIVQDGHGMIPLLAETKRGFISVKLINLLFGLLVGFIGLMAGF
jgi:putative 10TM heavy-metal exporter